MIMQKYHMSIYDTRIRVEKYIPAQKYNSIMYRLFNELQWNTQKITLCITHAAS